MHFTHRRQQWAIRLGHAAHSWYAGKPNPLLFDTRTEARSMAAYLKSRGAQVWRVVKCEMYVKDI